MKRAALMLTGVLTVSGLLVAGCGGSAEETSKTLVATLGDSITAGSPGYDPDPRMRETLGFGADGKSQWQYWAEKVDRTLRFRNCGVYGQRTDEIARRLDACAKGAQVLVVQGGINDVAQAYDVELAAKNLRTMVRRGKDLGLRVTIANVLPWNARWPGTEDAINGLNESIDELARDENVLVLPFYATLESSELPGRMRDEWTSDGDHPSVEGYRRLGELAFRVP